MELNFEKRIMCDHFTIDFTLMCDSLLAIHSPATDKTQNIDDVADGADAVGDDTHIVQYTYILQQAQPR